MQQRPNLARAKEQNSNFKLFKNMSFDNLEETKDYSRQISPRFSFLSAIHGANVPSSTAGTHENNYSTSTAKTGSGAN